MAGPLGVTHLLLFSRSRSGNTNLRIALTPRGPTLHFKVEKYSLCKDIKKAMKHPKGGKKEFLTAPLVCYSDSPPVHLRRAGLELKLTDIYLPACHEQFHFST